MTKNKPHEAPKCPCRACLDWAHDQLAKMPMDYGARQERALALVTKLRDVATRWPTTKLFGRTMQEIADEIERKTDFGREVVAVAGLVLRVLAQEPKRGP